MGLLTFLWFDARRDDMIWKCKRRSKGFSSEVQKLKIEHKGTRLVQ